MSVETGVRLLLGVFFLLTNAFFVASEFALTRLRQLPRDEIEETPALRLAWRMTEELEIYLSGCQVGITVSSIALGIVAEPAVTAVLLPAASALGVGEASVRPVAFAVAFVLINLAHVVVGEQAPTYLGVERTRGVARYCAPPLRLWTRIMSPVIRLADRVVKFGLGLVGVEITRAWAREDILADRAELRREIGELLVRGEVPRERRREVLGALDIGELPVREVMVPREGMVTLETGVPWEETLAVLREHAFVRFPVRDPDADRFVGFVYTPALFREIEGLRSGERELADVVSPLLTLGASTPVSRAIDELQAHRQEVALVVGEGAEPDDVLGMVTATDALEAITGQLRDPFDREGAEGGGGDGA